MRIYFIRGLLAGNHAEFTSSPVRIGRDDDNDLCLMTNGVSRHHAEIRRDDQGRWFISDKGSTNGTKLNGLPVTVDAQLDDGDEIEIGEQSFQFFAGSLDTDTAKVSVHKGEKSGDAGADVPVGTVQINLPGNGGKSIDLKPEVPEPEEKIPVPADNSGENNKPEEKPDPGIITRTVNFFDKGGKKPAENGTKVKADTPEECRRRRFHNLLYAVITGAVVLCVLAALVRHFSDPVREVKAPAAKPESRVLVEYERVILEKDNIFRFFVKITRRQAELTLDDLKHGRSLQRVVLNPKHLDLLIGRLQDSGITAEYPNGRFQFGSGDEIISGSGRWKEDDLVRHRLLWCENDRGFAARTAGEVVSRSWERVKEAFDVFAEGHGLQSISLTPQELLSHGEEAFRNAEELFANHEAALGNIRDAITRYEYAVQCFEQFDPKPLRWQQASRGLERAKKVREDKLKELKSEYSKFLHYRNLEGRRRALRQMMELCSEDSLSYERCRELLFQVDKQIKESVKR